MAAPDPDDLILPVLRETLAVRRTIEPTGALRVRVVPRRHSEALTVASTTESLAVERIPVGRVVDAPRGPWQDGDVLVVPVHEERLVVERRLVLVEEWRVHRRRSVAHESLAVDCWSDEVVVERRDATGAWQAVPAGTFGPISAGAPAAENAHRGAGREPAAASREPPHQRTPMRQTVVGVFDRFSSAQHAADLLRQRGIADDFIRITESDVEADDEARGPGLLDRIKHFFSGTSDDDFELSAYSEAVRRGGGVVKVEVDDEPEVEAAREVLQSAGAVDIDERVSEWKASGWAPDAGTAATAATTASMAGAATRGTRSDADQVIPVVREELAVGKRVVKAGGVRVYARTVEEAVHESVSLREERARVERRPVDRAASAADLEAVGERSIEIEETVERPVVEKTARVVEEVVVGKDVRQKQADVNETVRHTEVEVREFGGEEVDLAPARRFGETLAADERYRGREWSTVETDLRDTWQRDHPGSTWDEVKDTVREAWHRVTR
jgi:uncharacterized protein (TIGR02271 family)